MVKPALSNNARRLVKAAPAKRASGKVAPKRASSRTSARAPKESPFDNLKPNREKYTARELIGDLSEAVFGDEEEALKLIRTDERGQLRNPEKLIKAVLDQYDLLIAASLMPKSVGEFKIGRLIKIVNKDVPQKIRPAMPAGKFPNMFKKGKDGKPLMEDRPARPKTVIPAYTKPRAIATRVLKDIVDPALAKRKAAAKAAKAKR
jgi:hypothetical protein